MKLHPTHGFILEHEIMENGLDEGSVVTNGWSKKDIDEWVKYVALDFSLYDRK